MSYYPSDMDMSYCWYFVPCKWPHGVGILPRLRSAISKCLRGVTSGFLVANMEGYFDFMSPDDGSEIQNHANGCPCDEAPGPQEPRAGGP